MKTQIVQVAPLSLSQKIEALLMNRPVIMQLLRFAAIGILNTALDFIILNLFSKLFGINDGVRLGYLNALGFAAATAQSYIWNRYWAFEGAADVSLVKNFLRLVLVGGLGFIAMVLVLVGASKEAVPGFYLVVLIGFIVAEGFLWYKFRLTDGARVVGSHSTQFLAFVIVSLIGLFINSGLVSMLTKVLPETSFLNQDLLKNVAKIIATAVSLVWNFIGYKLIVFKK